MAKPRVLGSGDYVALSKAINTANDDYWIKYATQKIKSDYGDSVRVLTNEDGIGKNKDLLKFGATSAIGTSEKMIMTLAGSELAETFATDNTIDAIVSDDALNTQLLTIEGHKRLENNLMQFIVQQKRLTGQTRALLDTPLFRQTRTYVDDYLSLPIQSGSSVFTYESSGGVSAGGIPSSDASIHSIIQAGSSTVPYLRNNQTQKCATSVSYQDYLIITLVYAFMTRASGSNSSCDIFLKWRKIDATGPKAFRTVFVGSLNSNGSTGLYIDKPPYIIIPKNSDIIMTAIGSTTGIAVSAGFNGVLALVV